MNTAQLLQEITYRTSRSGGKGGQNVNKVETKVEACLDVAASAALSETEQQLIRQKLAGKISGNNILSVTNQTKRSQLAKKLMATQKTLRLVQTALLQPKKRKHSTPPPGVKATRLEDKRRLSDKKAIRRERDFQ